MSRFISAHKVKFMISRKGVSRNHRILPILKRQISEKEENKLTKNGVHIVVQPVNHVTFAVGIFQVVQNPKFVVESY
jgi:NADH dehydrogenase FAD-containing subunit